MRSRREAGPEVGVGGVLVLEGEGGAAAAVDGRDDVDVSVDFIAGLEDEVLVGLPLCNRRRRAERV